MTKNQEKRVEEIKSEAERQLFYNPDEYEFKEFTVKELGHSVSVVFEVGRKGDEGTMASIFGRDHGQLFIGKNGGLSYVNKKGTVKSLPRINLYTVVLEYN